jgi:hypothetical protein
MHAIELASLSYALNLLWHPNNLLAKASPAEVEALNSQIELLKLSLDTTTQFNKQMADSFRNYVSAIQVCFAFLGFGTAALSGVAAFFYGKSLNEARQTIDAEVKSEVSRQIQTSISGRINYLEDIIEREEVISKVNIEYLVPRGNSIPPEYHFLEARGFKINSIGYNCDNTKLESEVLVLDLVNTKTSESEKPQLVLEIGKKIAGQNQKPVLIIYINGHLDVIHQLSQEIYYLPANSKVALMGAVVNAANISYALRHRASS